MNVSSVNVGAEISDINSASKEITSSSKNFKLDLKFKESLDKCSREVSNKYSRDLREDRTVIKQEEGAAKSNKAANDLVKDSHDKIDVKNDYSKDKIKGLGDRYKISEPLEDSDSSSKNIYEAIQKIIANLLYPENKALQFNNEDFSEMNSEGLNEIDMNLKNFQLNELISNTSLGDIYDKNAGFDADGKVIPEESIEKLIQTLMDKSDLEDLNPKQLEEVKNLVNDLLQKVEENTVSSQDNNISKLIAVLKENYNLNLDDKDDENQGRGESNLKSKFIESAPNFAVNKTLINNLNKSEENSLNMSLGKEDKILKDILKEKPDSISSKAILFSEFSKVNNDSLMESVKGVSFAPEVNRANILNEIIKSVKYMEINNIKELTVKLNPKELGQLVIRLTMESGLMKASITANNKDTYSLINSNLNNLKGDLNNSQLKIEEVFANYQPEASKDFSQFNNSSSEGKHYSGKNNDSNKISSIENIEEDTIEEDTALDGNINILA